MHNLISKLPPVAPFKCQILFYLIMNFKYVLFITMPSKPKFLNYIVGKREMIPNDHILLPIAVPERQEDRDR